MRKQRFGGWIAALASAITFIKRQCRAERRRSVMGGRRFASAVGSFAIAILASQLCMAPAWAQQAPAPPDLGPAYFAKEKDPKDPKKDRPTKTIRPTCAGCQAEQDALQEAVEN
jgi:hypothetical protein